MKITKVKTTKLANRMKSLIGFATVTFDDVLTIPNFKIFEKNGRIWASFPQRDKGNKFRGNDRFENTAFIKNPLNKEIRDMIVDTFNKEHGNIRDNVEENTPEPEKDNVINDEDLPF